MKLVVEAPGKVILSGEHAVVYDYPAMVVAVERKLSLRVRWEEPLDKGQFRDLLKKFERMGTGGILEAMRGLGVKTKIESEIPIGCGMGSSAALAGALSLAMLVLAGMEVDLNVVCDYAFRLERQAHLNPSGVDNTMTTFGGMRRYQKMGDSVKLSKLDSWRGLDGILVVNTGRPTESTGEMVAKVRELAKTDPQKVDRVMRQIGRATEMILQQNRIARAIKSNETALEELGVVGEKAQKTIREVEKRGGVAKISGAGGYKTNSGIIMVYAPGNKEVKEFLDATGLESFPIKVSKGIRYRIE